MKAKLGIAPIAWTNDDLPELGGDTPLETCLRESRAAGFSGVEMGGKFPRTTAELEPILQSHELYLCSGWYSGTVLDAPDDLVAEKEKAFAQLKLFRELGAPCIVYGETAGTLQNRRNAPLNLRRRLWEDEIKAYGRRLTRFAEYCAEQGMPLAFHHHMATAIETERDIDILMDNTGPAVGLLYDTGHLRFAGADLFRVLDKYGCRINHVHTKDLRGKVVAKLDRERQSFLDAVLAGAFTVPGDGDIDFGPVTKRLAEIGYEGWFVVEAEQDPTKAPPGEFAKIGHKALTQALTAAGYEIEGAAV
ncbi:myo-inosose-2 dehydratase [Acidocella aminolytica]|jgi:inosose dehydratase|uniref:Inosose dehydratase n=1 Tax=Acidocella aminolytica 101 = DSM 11237 TaxID=1120923 RepID=A0A0D6PI76_9PROT|nr:myo-inosose-2 dehydratase [Acidocella aminolytica]GAN80529.1 inosose dehydratase [Acidocella aminolytica 101 = DSM 11237]GBQ37750.1 sugar phosphate isomerase/epimerase [Acidocella aminolytica 101 = DSM 11237]SHF39958.1 2-keto-myo-inositol dehydratase [Acidocella aminolytica 101 = DSM 11237]